MKKGFIIGLIIIVVVIIGIVIYSLNSNSSSSTYRNGDKTASDGSRTSETSAGGVGKDIDITDFAFTPSIISIKKGDMIRWANKDSAPHTVTSDSGSELASATLSNGKTYSHTFNTAGTYSYHCDIHPSMKAKIIVE